MRALETVPDLEHRIATALDRASQELTEHWLRRVEQRLFVRPRGHIDAEWLHDRMPRIIAAMARAIEDEDYLRRDEVVGLLQRVARQRYEMGHDVQELLVEAELMGEVLFDRLANEVETHAQQLAPAAALRPAARLHNALAALSTIYAGTLRELTVDNQRELGQRLETFGRTLAHELKNPLGAAEGAAQLLVEDEILGNPEQRRSFVEMVLRNLARAKDLVQDVRTLAHLQRAEGEPPPHVPLRDAVEAVVNEMAPRAETVGVHMRVIEPLPGSQVDRRVELVLANLVGNAIKYADPEKRERLVTISATFEARTERWRISVRDNGIGIREEFHDRVFERFFRAHPEQATGTGLGLSIAREAIEQMGGEIGFHSEPGRGSDFYFTLPADSARRRATRTAGDGRSGSAAGLDLSVQ